MNSNTPKDYIAELADYLQSIDISDYQKFVELSFRAPNDLKILISEVGRLRSDIERYREDITNLRKNIIEREQIDNINRIKATKYDRLVEMLQPTDGGKYVNDVVEAFWRYLRELQYLDTDDTTKPSKAMVEYHLKRVTSIDDPNISIVKDIKTNDDKDKTAIKRNTPVLDIKRVDADDGKSNT